MSRTISGREWDILPATVAQMNYVDGLRRKLHLTEALLNNHCVARFKRPLKRLDHGMVSALIDEMKEWQAIPADLLREAGQMDLFHE